MVKYKHFPSEDIASPKCSASSCCHCISSLLLHEQGTGFHLFLAIAFAHVVRLFVVTDGFAFPLSLGRFHVSLPCASQRWNKAPPAAAGGLRAEHACVAPSHG